MPSGADDQRIDFSKTLVGDDPVGPLAKLLWECRTILDTATTDPLVRMFMSQNAASTAWHIHEWLWKLCPLGKRELLLATVGASTPNWKGYVTGIQRSHMAIAVCRQLATAGKHVTIDHERNDVCIEVEHDAVANRVGVFVCIADERWPDIVVYAAALRWWLELYIGLGYNQAEALRKALDQAGVARA